MKKSKQLVVVTLCLSGLIGMMLSNTESVNTQSSDAINSIRQEANKSDENFPVVSLDTSKRSGKTDESRKKKNEKFDKWDWVAKTVGAEETSAILTNDWEVGLPALPVKKSDAIIVGTVNNGEAFLSNDGTGIYSEFSVSVNDLMKNDRNGSIKLNDTIKIQRAGGRILYPSGKILRYAVSGQDMPHLNGKYVFFLTYDEQRQSYYIVTAYEISDGKILALDGRGKSKNSSSKFSKYNGTDELLFINELKNALDAQKKSSEEGTAQ